MGRVFYDRRDYEQARRYYEEALELERDFPPGLLGLGLTHLVERQYSEAAARFQKALPQKLQPLVEAVRMAAESSTRTKALRQAFPESVREARWAFHLVVVACLLGSTDEAFHWLNQAANMRSEYLVYIGVDTLFDPLRQDLRFNEHLSRIGLEAD